MLGFLIGTACLIGLFKVLRRGSRGYGYGGCGGYGARWGGGGFGGPWHGRGRWGEGGHGFRERGFGGGPGFVLRAILGQVDASPAQEKVIVAAFDELREAAMKSRDELHRTRADVAKAMRGASFDEVLFGELFARHDTAIESFRKSSIGALAKVHEALDERQRARLADLIESGPGFFRPWREHGYQA